MKRMIVAVACSSCLVAPSRASSSGWSGGGAAGTGSTAGADQSWLKTPPSPPSSATPNSPDQRSSPADGIRPPGVEYGEANALQETSGSDYGDRYPDRAHAERYSEIPNDSRHSAHHLTVTGAGADFGVHDNPRSYDEQEQQQQYQRYQDQQHRGPHEPPPAYIPHESRWAGGQQQHDHDPSEFYRSYERQQQQQQQQQQPQQQHQGYPMYGNQEVFQQSTPPFEASGLGTAWRSIVSRVKDAVRPGEASDYAPPGGRGFQSGYAGGGGDGGYQPLGSSWVGGGNHNAGYAAPAPGAYDQTPPNLNGRYDHEQPGNFGSGYGPGAAQEGGYDYRTPDENGTGALGSDRFRQQHHAEPPPPFIDPQSTGNPFPPPQGVEAGRSAWQDPPPAPHVSSSAAAATATAPQRGSDVYGDSIADSRYESQRDGDFYGGEYRGYVQEREAGNGVPGANTEELEAHRRAGRGGQPYPRRMETPSNEHREASYTPPAPPPPQAMVGQGWATSSPSTRIAHPPPPPPPPPSQQAQPQGRRLRPLDQAPGQFAGDDAPAATPDRSFERSSTSSSLSRGARADIADTQGERVSTPSVAGKEASSTAAAVPLKAQEPGTQAQRGNLLSTPSVGEESLPRAASRDAVDAEMAPSDLAESGVSQEQRGMVGKNHVGRSSLSRSQQTLGPFASRAEHDRGGSYASLDMMPTSADHGMERVDWGKGAESEQDQQGNASGETAAEMEGRDRLEHDEEALIRELKRMDSSVGGGQLPGDGDGADNSDDMEMIGSRSARDEKQEGNALAETQQDTVDTALRWQRDDPVDVGGDGVGGVTGHPERTSPSRSISSKTASLASPVAKDGPESVTVSESARNKDMGIREDHNIIEYKSAGDEGLADAVSDAATEAIEAEAKEDGSAETRDKPLAAGVASEDTASEKNTTDVIEVAGTMWGKTRRWDSLPPLTVVVSEPKVLDKAEGQGWDTDIDDLDEDRSHVTVPLDPIELPPSAANDEIWNDQHLQDQLDAYWEQSGMRARSYGGGDGSEGDRDGGMVGVSSPPSGARQLSAYSGHLQPAYGPGDWAGKGASVMQELLPGVTTDGAMRNGWVTPRPLGGIQAPIQRNQAPINIYGNVHVHLQQGSGELDAGEGPAAALSDLSARERYHSQGETSWSGSDRGGQ